MTKRPVRPLPAIDPLRFLVILFIFAFYIFPSSAAGIVFVDYFYEDGCSKCAQASPVLDEVVRGYENITYSQYEIMTKYNGATGYELMRIYGLNTVPAVVINRQTTITYADYNGNTTLLRALMVEGIENSSNVSSMVPPEDNKLPELSIPVVFIAGLLTGFNPCLLAIMAFLASVTLSAKGKRRDLLKIVAGFCAGLFAVYMLVGLGLLGAVKQQPGFIGQITSLLALFIGLLGLWHFYDAYHLKTHDRSSFKTPAGLIHLIRSMEKGRHVMGISFLAGAIFSLVKAPCVGAVYLAVLDMLISKGQVAEGSIYLGVFNLGVVLPVLILGAMLAFGLSPDKVNEFKEKRRIGIRLVTGVVLIVLAILIYLKMI